MRSRRAVCWLVWLVTCAAAAEPPKRVALTIDDGPNPEFSAASLRLFEQHGVKVTYFVCGYMLAAYPDLAKAVAAAGHELGNHSYNHPNMTALGPEQREYQIRRTNELIREQTGQTAVYFRPPYGRVNQAVRDSVAAFGMNVALWNVDPADWRPGATAAAVTRHVLGQARDGAIILLHEKKTTLAALPGILNGLRERGYQVVSYGRLMHPEARPTEPTWIELDGDTPAGGWSDPAALRFRLTTPQHAVGTFWVHLLPQADPARPQAVVLNGERLGAFSGQAIVRAELTANDTARGELRIEVKGVDGAAVRVRALGFTTGSGE